MYMEYQQAKRVAWAAWRMSDTRAMPCYLVVRDAMYPEGLQYHPWALRLNGALWLNGACWLKRTAKAIDENLNEVTAPLHRDHHTA